MNTKNKIIAILMASIVAMAVGVPMAMGGNQATTGGTVTNPAAVIASLDAPTTNITLTPGNSSSTTDIIVTVTLSDDNGDNSLEDSYTAKINTASTGAGTQIGSDITVNVVAGTKDGTDLTAQYNNSGGAIPYSTAPDTYYVRIYNGSTEISPDTGVSVSVNISTLRSLNLNTTVITFGDMVPNSTKNDTSADIIAWNDGNVNNTPTAAFDNTANLTHTVDGTEIIPGTGLAHNIDSFSTVIPTNFDTADFKLYVPTGTKTGTYTGTLQITAEA